jgi:hypothetical protein
VLFVYCGLQAMAKLPRLQEQALRTCKAWLAGQRNIPKKMRTAWGDAKGAFEKVAMPSFHGMHKQIWGNYPGNQRYIFNNKVSSAT